VINKFRSTGTDRGRPIAVQLFRRLWRACGGATAVEMAFLLPVFLLFIVAIEEFGRALWTATALQFAVEAAARCAVLYQPNADANCAGDVRTYAANQAYGLSIPKTAFTYTQNATCGVVSSTNGAQVETTPPGYAFQSVLDISGLYTMLGVAKGQNPLAVNLYAKSCHP